MYKNNGRYNHNCNIYCNITCFNTKWIHRRTIVKLGLDISTRTNYCVFVSIVKDTHMMNILDISLYAKKICIYLL
jgi:hypothetical protein